MYGRNDPDVVNITDEHIEKSIEHLKENVYLKIKDEILYSAP